MRAGADNAVSRTPFLTYAITAGMAGTAFTAERPTASGNAYLSKPIAISRLREALKIWLPRNRPPKRGARGRLHPLKTTWLPRPLTPENQAVVCRNRHFRSTGHLSLVCARIPAPSSRPAGGQANICFRWFAVQRSLGLWVRCSIVVAPTYPVAVPPVVLLAPFPLALAIRQRPVGSRFARRRSRHRQEVP
jgi:hypothetical protein